MMTNNKNFLKSAKRYVVLFPLMILAIFTVSMINPSQSQEYNTENSIRVLVGDSTIFNVVEQMPIFRGCDEFNQYEERNRKICSDEKLMQFIYQNILYPEAAYKSGKEGTSVVRFIVEKDGSVSNVEVVRSISDEFDLESLRVIKLMESEKMWTAGRQRNVPVRVVYNIPIRFSLND